MSSFVLVHGSWFGGWCWEKVASRLRERGHLVLAPDLPAHGDDRTPVAQASLAGYADAIARRIDALEGQVVLVGHSMAGAVVSEVAERRPEKVGRLVYVAAYLLADGQSIFQFATQDAASKLGPHLRPDEKGGVLGVTPEGVGAALLSGCSTTDVDAARKRALPDPLAPLATPVHVTAARWGRVPRTYVHTTRDLAVSHDLQTKLVKASPCERTHSLETGHAPFLEAAPRLVEILQRES